MHWIFQHKILILGFVVAVTVFVWFALGSGTPAPQLITPEVVSTGSPVVDNADQNLVETLLTLRTVNLNSMIFQDPAFRSLRDFGTPVIPEPMGRENPFAPLPSSLPGQQGEPEASGL